MITDEINERAYKAACLRPNGEISGSITRGDMQRALTAVLPMIRDDVLEECARLADAQADKERAGLFDEMRRRRKNQTLIDQLCFGTSLLEQVSIDLRAMKGGEG